MCERMGEHEDADGHRPSDHEKRLEELADRLDHLRRTVAVIDGECGKDDGQQRHRHEEQGLEWFVGEAIPAGLRVRAQRVHDRLVDAEVEDGEDEGQGERQALPEPPAQHRQLEAPADHRDALGGEDDREVDAAERVLRRVRPHEVGDVAIRLDAVDDEAEKQRAFENDREGLVAEPLDRVQAVAQQRGV